MRRSLIRKIRQASWRTLVGSAVVIVALGLARPTLTSLLAGLPLVVVGELIRIWGCGHLVKTSELIVSGPFAYVQHPLYLGTGFIAPGLMIAGGAPWWLTVALMAFYIGYYVRRKHRIESGRLREIYGEKHAAYEAAVPVLLPYRRPYRPAGTQSASWNPQRVSQNSEDGTVYALVAIAIYLFVLAWI